MIPYTAPDAPTMATGAADATARMVLNTPASTPQVR